MLSGWLCNVGCCVIYVSLGQIVCDIERSEQHFLLIATKIKARIVNKHA